MPVCGRVRQVIFLLVLVAPLRCLPQELTEEQALTLLAESPRLRELAARVRVVRAETQAWSRPSNPVGNYTREGTDGTHFLQVEQVLPVSGRLGLLKRAGEAAREAAQAGFGAAVHQIRSDFRAVFHALLFAQEREAAVRRSRSTLEEVIKVLRDREREGEGSAFDRMRAERELAALEAELADSRILVAQAGARLGSYLPADRSPSRVAGDVRSRKELPPLQEVLALALANRKELEAESHFLRRHQFERQAAERLRIPEPAVNAGLKRISLPGIVATGSVVAVSLPIPLFNRGQAEAARAEAELERQQASRQALARQIEADVAAAYQTVELRRSAVDEYARNAAGPDRELREIARAAYQEGERGILELLDAYRLGIQSELRVIDLLAALRAAEIELERVVGKEVLR